MENELTEIVSSHKGSAPIKIGQEASVSVGEFSKDKIYTCKIDEFKYSYLVLVEGKIEVDGVELSSGDAIESDSNLANQVYEALGFDVNITLETEKGNVSISWIDNSFKIAFENGEIREISGAVIPIDISNKIFNRNKEVKWVEYSFQ